MQDTLDPSTPEGAGDFIEIVLPLHYLTHFYMDLSLKGQIKQPNEFPSREVTGAAVYQLLSEQNI